MTGAATAGGLLCDGSVTGLGYRTDSLVGTTEAGRFLYLPGEKVSFFLAATQVGEALAHAVMTAADLYPSAEPLADWRVINCSRLLQGLGRSAAAEVDGPLRFDVPPDEFAAASADWFVDLPSETASRNELRRLLAGIRKEPDVRVPMRDGSFLLADVYRPVGDERYPAILRMSVYGRAFGAGSICNEGDREAAEVREQDWFEGRRSGLTPMVRYAENAVSANAFDWVPRGYALVRVDPRGVGPTPGTLEPFSQQESRDYFDAIEWTAEQPWCTGSVGLLGASYAATNQWNVASLKPPSLRAMIPWAGDADGYRDLAYPGGIFQEGYRRNWWSFVTSLQCRAPESDFVEQLAAHPFDEPDFYGGLSPRLNDVEVPFLTAVSQTATLHGRAGFEAFGRTRSSDRRLVVVAANYFSFLYRECLDLQFEFFDQYLKGVSTGGSERRPPVRLMMRTGHGEYSWRDEDDWPVPGTVYREWYLDSEGRLAPEQPRSEGLVAYSAEYATGGSRSEAGVSFLSDPLSEELLLAGHFTARLWVSATASDMDVFAALRVIGPDGAEVRYAVRDRTSEEPVTWGCLKVSHRATDPDCSSVRPWHTHRRSDLAPIEPGQVVEVDIEMMPATAEIPAGCRLRLDVQPVEGPGGYRDAQGRQVGRAYDHSYHDGCENMVHTGPIRRSRLILPVVPSRAHPESWM